MPGIISVFTQGNPIGPIVQDAALDTGILALVLIIVMMSGALIEFVFKNILGCFIGDNKVEMIESYLTYPGVLYHELSHALFAFLTGAQVTSLSLRRKPSADGTTTLGSVTYAPRGSQFMRALQSTMASIAPCIMGVLGMVAIALFAFPHCDAWWQWVIWIYLFVCILLHSALSATDLKAAVGGLPIFLIGVFVIFLFFPFDITWWQAMIASIASGEGWTGMWERLGDVWTAFANNDTQGIIKSVTELGTEASDAASNMIQNAVDATGNATGVDTSNITGNAPDVLNGVQDMYTSEEEAGHPLEGLRNGTTDLFQNMTDYFQGQE